MKKLQPVKVDGIEFDALISSDDTMESEIPQYPIEDGFEVSDTIINKPRTLNMTLFIAISPLTYISTHSGGESYVNAIVGKLENLWQSKKRISIVMPEKTYKNMCVTSIKNSKSTDIHYSRQVEIQAGAVRVTATKTATIPSYAPKSGKTKAKAGKANTSKTPKKTSSKKSSSTSKKQAKNWVGTTKNVYGQTLDVFEGGGSTKGYRYASVHHEYGKNAKDDAKYANSKLTSKYNATKKNSLVK